MQFNRDEWAKLRNAVPMMLLPEELEQLQGINEDLSMDEISEIYLPLARLLTYYISNHHSHQSILSQFLGQSYKSPFIIGIAGSVAVGKSTTARVIQTLLSRWPEHRSVKLITTDGFLYPNTQLEEHGLMDKKGFPESYDIKKLMTFISDVKSGKQNITAPVYSHLVYDVVPDKVDIVDSSDVLIIEGLNVLQSALENEQIDNRHFVSDFLDFSIYVDAEIPLLNEWYINRFLKFRSSAFSDPNSYFHHYAKISTEEALDIANRVWKQVNEKNLIDNILPTRARASLILTKGEHHRVESVMLRK